MNYVVLTITIPKFATSRSEALSTVLSIEESSVVAFVEICDVMTQKRCHINDCTFTIIVFIYFSD